MLVADQIIHYICRIIENIIFTVSGCHTRVVEVKHDNNHFKN